jgi:regulator of nucleoside diphosphate kinase
MNENRVQQLIAKAIVADHIDRARYYHVCWWEGRLQCLHVHHAQDIHPVFFAASGNTFMEVLHPCQWRLVTHRVLDFCRRHNIAPSGRSPQHEASACTESFWQRPQVTALDSRRLWRLLKSAQPAGVSADPYLSKLRRLLDTADTVAPREIARDVVTMNSRVSLRDDDDDSEMNISLVFPADATGRADSDMRRLSILTEIGVSMLGRHVGNSVGGGLRIHELPYQPEAAGDLDL